ANHRQAILKLGLLADQGKPAVPVVFHQIKKCQEQLAGGPSRWNEPTLVEVITDHMKTLPKIAPEDPQVVKTIIELAKFTTPRPLFINTGLGFRQTKTPFRHEAVPLLGELAEGVAGHQKQIVPPLVALLKEAVQRTGSDQEFEVLGAIHEVE